MLLYFLRTSIWFNYPVLLKMFEKTVRDGLLKVCDVNFDNILSTQLVLLAEMGGLGVSSVSLLALSTFLFSAFGASDFLTTIFLETFENFRLQKRLRNGWVGRMNRKVLSMKDRKIGHNLSTSKPPKTWFQEWMTNVRKFLPLIKAFGSQWLNVVPCKNLGLKRDDQRLRI